ncbi:MAG: hypothetical protein HY738_13300 [Bacteroidia bacterium]|nr:hypothetical protein [Bacteroidia bacterium]
MKNDYLCPKCRGFLNVEDNICFSVKSKRGQAGLKGGKVAPFGEHASRYLSILKYGTYK